jgi:virginiamycin B lyase
VFFASLAGNYLGQIDPESGTVAVLDPPIPRQGARRVWSDSRGALWITGWNSGDLFRYDSKTKAWTRWHLPGDGPQPYAVYVDETDAPDRFAILLSKLARLGAKSAYHTRLT